MTTLASQTSPAVFSKGVLKIDPSCITKQITSAIRHQILHTLKRRGAVVGLSGGIDSSVTAALCVQALGKEHVLALLMPEADSDPQSLELARLLAQQLGIATVVEDIAPILSALGCYRRRDEAIRHLYPAWTSQCKCKLTLARQGGYNLFYLVVQNELGQQQTLRLPLEAYLGIVAATNFKQRTRKQLEYYHADRLNYAVVGTPNRLEYDQGFFVKNGDGAADLKPIAHLYKSQVYQLAEYLGIPEVIRRRPPTTDTYSLPQTQEEFYFALPYELMDLCLWAWNHAIPPESVATELHLSPDQVRHVYQDIQAKRRTTAYQHRPPLLAQGVPEIHACSAGPTDAPWF
ncbi:MAG TPA: NAD(+) synthase [Tepidisphaeraceae bacterium]|nr:NAD(+) synthase [Tepidisphaeraceae bacterium]